MDNRNAILAYDPAYGLTGSKPALVCLWPDKDGFDIDWCAFRPIIKNLDDPEARDIDDQHNDRYAEILSGINAFAQPYITEIKILAVYKTAFGSAALGLTQAMGMFIGWGWMNGITDVWRVQDNTVKAAIAGSGRASKEAVARAVKAQWAGMPGDEPDVSDAAALALYVANRKRKAVK